MTPRVRIVQLSPETLAALATGNLAAATATMPPVPLSPYLASEQCVWTWNYRARQVLESPEDLPWVTGVIWDEDRSLAAGRAGFHAAPTAEGMVEVGYGVDPDLRRRGYARAALITLMERARTEPTVRTLRATISPDNTASLNLILDYGFAEVGEQWDDEDGLETIYEIPVG